MSASALICLYPGSEETEAVTTIDLLVRGGVKVTTASVASDGNLTIICSRGVACWGRCAVGAGRRRFRYSCTARRH